jgi:NAD(P)-dependent dehydrogenase (short-subunit alcohol dehydrogenase family)
LLKRLKIKNPSSSIIQADVSKYSDVSRMIQEVKNTYGRIDGLVNCAGIVEFQNLESLNELNIDQQIKVNLLGTIYVMKEALPLLKASDCASVVNISSLAARVGQTDISLYAASKGGVASFTRSCAVELAPDIRVNSVSPGIIDTGIKLNNLDPIQIQNNRKKLMDRIPLKRMGKTDDVTNLIEFLLSNQSSYITGQDLVVDGGWSIS